MMQKLITNIGLVATVYTLSLFLLNCQRANAVERWSRQLEPTIGGEQTDSFDDWIPLAQPVDGSSKDRAARVLTYSQAFPPNNRFASEFPKPQAPFDYAYQFPRFSNPQQQPPPPPPPRQHLVPNLAPVAAPLKANAPPSQGQEPTSQSFFKFEMPYHSDPAAGGPPTVQTGYQIQHTFGGGAQATLFNSPFFNQQPVLPPEFHPLPHKSFQQPLKQKPLPQQNFIEDSLPVKNIYRESKPAPTQQSLQAVTPQVFPVDAQPEPAFGLNKPTSFQPPTAPGQHQHQHQHQQQQQQQPQEVQLLYVPYDTLYNQQNSQQQQPLHNSPGAQNTAFEVNKFNLNAGLPAVNPYQINQFYTQDPLAGPHDPNFFATSTTSRPLTSPKPGNVFQSYTLPLATTTKPKPKAHQPPLSMFFLRRSARPTQADIVAILRDANTIAVVDAPTKSTPEIFIGPAGMPIPEGYVKFDLPYLSQLTHSRDLSDIPFFVAPLSYRTPEGFNKILLPEPHVGSIVVNRNKAGADTNSLFNAPNDIGPVRQRPAGHRVKPSKEYYREPTKTTNNLFEVTTQRATLSPTRGNKYSYFLDQDQAIHEVTSPKITKPDRPKKKRPQNVQVEQTAYTTTITNPYAQFKPIPNQIGSDDYYKVQPNKPHSTSTSSTTSTTSSTSTTTTSTTPSPENFFTYHPAAGPEVEFQSTNGQLYHNFNKSPAASDEHVPRFTTRPPPASNALDEEFRMKQYFRQQDAFRSRPHFVNPTNAPFEQVQYTPVQLDYDREAGTPSTTDKTTTTTKHRVTFYTPSATPATTSFEGAAYNTLPPRENIAEYNSVQLNQPAGPAPGVPSNHRPSYNNQNEILDGTVEYEPNPYQLPAELPSLSPQLPGLVNNLQEKRKQQQQQQQQEAEEQAAQTTTTPEAEPATRPTRRPLNRVRKPVVTKVTSSVSYSESETSSRRPTQQRVRRPFGSRGTTSSDDEGASTTTTRRPGSSSTGSRNPLVRNPNRVRYQPTTEERQSLRLKPKKQYNGSKKTSDSEDLEYQRDVLKQNYPVFKGRKPTSPTAIPSSYAITSTEGSTSESQQVYTVTPSNNIDQNEQNFPANLLESMQIPQQYEEYSKENYGPGYFPNQEDLSPTEPSTRNEITPIFTTSSTSSTTTTTTTEEPPTATTRRSPFLRRNYPRLRTTTTEAPATTTQTPEERSSIRPRIPPRKVIKVRTRTRRPTHPASSTNAPQEDAPEEDERKTNNNYRKLSRFNADLYENDTPKRRYKSKFQLEGQESQWSPALKTNNFRPLQANEARDAEQEQKFDNEQEIITANPNSEANNDEKKSDTYEFNVSANFGSSDSTVKKTTMKEPNLKPEKSFAELLEEVMGKAPEEAQAVVAATTDDSRTTDGTYFESQKTTISDRLNRRSKWKKLRSSSKNTESFETAESQNIGTQLYNSLKTNDQGKSISEIIFKSTTPMTTVHTEPPATTMTTPETQYPVTTTPIPMTTVNSDNLGDLFTTAASSLTTLAPEKQPMPEDDSATRRSDQGAPMDDLETQSSLFSEVKRQLHELFAIEDNEDDHAVTAALAAVGRRRQEYTNIKREKPLTTESSVEATTPLSFTTTTAAPRGRGAEAAAASSTVPSVPATEATNAGASNNKSFHTNLMDNVVYATSTSTKVSSETEICYRGRCIRSEDLPPNHKLN